jgi:AraC-like DNA-binding protein
MLPTRKNRSRKKKAFETAGKTIAEVTYDVGYSDAKGFREVSRKTTGMLLSKIVANRPAYRRK